MAKEKKTIMDDYFDKYKHFNRKYGAIILFYEIGSFMEMYGVDNEEHKIGNVKEISQILNIQLTRRSKSIAENSVKNPLMAGIPSISFKRYLDNLVKLNKYTIVIVGQVTPPPNPKRKVTEIISPGTYIDHFNKDSNNLISIFIQEEYGKNFIIGCSLIDVSTGKTLTFETQSIQNDNMYSFNEAERFIKSNYPKEIIVNCNNLKSFNEEDIVNKLGIHNMVYHINIDKIEKESLKVSYQEELLSTIFENETMLTYSELLNLEKSPFALNSFILLLKFVYEHNPLIIEKIFKPEILEENKYLNLANNAISQLNLISKDDYLNDSYTSLFNIIDNTSTSLGRRLLKFKLLNPILDISELNNQYKNIELMMNNYKPIEKELDKIYDIERLHRKLLLKKLNPSEFVLLHNSYEGINEIINYFSKAKDMKDNKDFILDKVVQESFNSFTKEYTDIFNINEMSKHNIVDINGNFFNEGFNENIDNILNEISKNKKQLELIVEEFNNLVDGNDYFKISDTPSEGYYIHITTTRFNDFLKKKVIEKRKVMETPKNYSKSLLGNIPSKTKVKMEITDDDIQNISDYFTFSLEGLKVKNFTNNKKITLDLLNEASNNLVLLNDKIIKIIKKEYIKCLENFSLKYENTFIELSKYISYIDLNKSNAKTAILNNYNKPTIIEDSESSFVDIENLRHPIVEKIENNNEYVSNNIKLGNNFELGSSSLDGMLLFGLNASGKSTLMKSLGISIVMAQSGMFVPASKMNYNPFHKIFTRISGEDNLFKGLSSFAVEMTELRNILKNSNQNTLVLGDEISHGTETVSGVSIVASSLIHLSDIKSKFLFATHLHELATMDEVQDIKTLKNYHLEVKYQEEEDLLIYNRKLKEGSGSSIYGLEVAKAMDLDKSFIQRAYDIRNKIIDEKSSTKLDLILNKSKSSKYNKELYIEKCYLCDRNADHTHHIQEQKESDSNGFLEIKHKNHKSNLIPLCEKDHQNLHKIMIKEPELSSEGGMKWLETSTGKKLWINPKLVKLMNIDLESKKDLISF